MKALLLTEHRPMALPLPSQAWPRRDRHCHAQSEPTRCRRLMASHLSQLHAARRRVDTVEPNRRPQPPQTGFATGARITQSECDIMAICELQSALLYLR